MAVTIKPSSAVSQSKHLRNVDEEQTCTSSSTCPDGHFCKFEDEACNTQEFASLSGVCEKLNFRCTRIFRPVCGCDNETYANSCLALSHGVSVMAFNTCEDGEEGETR
ncbi:hypothetical protein ACHAXN_010603 [Cyclotella atomus]